MRYSVEFDGGAERYLSRIDRRRQEQIAARIEELQADPFDPATSKLLHGHLSGLRSSRVGDLRIVFEVVHDRLLIYVVRIGPRGDVCGQ